MSFLAQFNHQISGPEDGSKWVFLHGLMGYGLNWRRIVSAFENEHRILTFDQRGHGKSIKPAEGYRPEDFADDLLAILNELGWEKITLVGHSMGGRNAMNFASRFPERVEKLVIEDIGPDAKPAAIGGIAELLNVVPTPFVNKVTAKEFFLNEFPKRITNRENIKTLGSYLYANIVEKENGQADWRFSKDSILLAIKEGRAQDRWSEYEALKMPILVIRGSTSVDLTQDVYLEMLKRNSHATGVLIEPSGHWVHSEQPEKFIAALREFTRD